MAAFEYRCLDHKGKMRKGTMEADSARWVRQKLREKGWVPVAVEEIQGQTQRTRLFSRSGKLNTAQQALITRQMATLIRSGLPVEEALSSVAKQHNKEHVVHIILGVRSKVMEGYSLAASLADYPKAFNQMYCATVAAGEKSGHLEQVLEQLAEYLETRSDAGRTVTQSLIYPAFIMVFSLVIIVLMMTYVVPRMVEVFSRNEQALPILTRIMIAVSDFLRDWLWLVALIINIAVVIFIRALKYPKFRMRRTEEHTSDIQSRGPLVCSILLDNRSGES